MSSAVQLRKVRLTRWVILVIAVSLLGLFVPGRAHAASATIMVSSSATRTNAVTLAGTTRSGNLYIFTTPTSGITKVSFWLDDPQRVGLPKQVETAAPFDFRGGNTTTANPWASTSVANGTHSITVQVVDSAKVTTTLTASFTVSNGTAAGYAPQASTSSNRSAPFPVAGAVLHDNVYLFVPSVIGITKVSFYLDDSARAHAPRHVENTAPWDFVSTGTTSATASVRDELAANGTHVLSVDVAAGTVVTKLERDLHRAQHRGHTDYRASHDHRAAHHHTAPGGHAHAAGTATTTPPASTPHRRRRPPPPRHRRRARRRPVRLPRPPCADHDCSRAVRHALHVQDDRAHADRHHRGQLGGGQRQAVRLRRLRRAGASAGPDLTGVGLRPGHQRLDEPATDADAWHLPCRHRHRRHAVHLLRRWLHLRPDAEGAAQGQPGGLALRHPDQHLPRDARAAQNRASGGLSYIGGKIYYFGGSENYMVTPDHGEMWSLDVAHGATTWVQLATMPDPRNHFGWVTINGKIYVAGGQHQEASDSTAQSELDSYDPATNKWTTLAPMPAPRGHMLDSSFVINGRFIVATGWTTTAAPLR